MAHALIKLRNLSYAYPGRRVFERVNFDLRCGERVALVGDNGAGKTTLLQLMAQTFLR